jgi:gas vesicle protein GvpN
MKYEEDAVQLWVDQRLTTACREGFTLVYDEFTRSRPEANNVLLAVLEERMLVLPTTTRENAYVKVHPELRAIFTSNAQEYAGVHAAQDALFDRMVTMDLDYYDRETEILIAAARSGISEDDAAGIVDLVRECRHSEKYDQAPSLRACIMIAKVAAMQGAQPSADDPHFVKVCLDVLESKSSPPKDGEETRDENQQSLVDLIRRNCGGSSPVKKARGK